MIKIHPIDKKNAHIACIKWHYTKKAPPLSRYYGIWENNNIIGMVSFGFGGINMGKGEGFKPKEVTELNRVAFSQKKTKHTSFYLMQVIKFFKQSNKDIKAIYSYADNGQNHIGILYQACNFFYIRNSANAYDWVKNGKIIHGRNFSNSAVPISKGYTKMKKSQKYLYVYPLTKKSYKVLKSISKPFPKICG